MAKWYEGAEEAAFKPTVGGYVFEPPSIFWPFTHAGCYLVNEAQRADIAACLRRQRRGVIFLAIVYVLIFLGVVGVIGASDFAQRRAILIAMALALVLIAILPHFYLVRTLRPLLAGLPHTDERIAFGDRLNSLAATMSSKLLLLGAISGGLMIIGNLFSIIVAIVEGRGGSELHWAIFGLVCGALLSSYFSYLTFLKRRLKRQVN